LLTFIDEWFGNLFDYELIVSIGKLVYTSENMVRTILVGAGYIIASAAGGFLLFRKAEIK
jgi:hypothetical protein